MSKIYTKKIYKCAFCDNYFLCDKCYKILNNNKEFHQHEVFFEINYPNNIIKIIGELQNTVFNNIINSFYILLNKIFFDENGNITTKPFNNDDIHNLKNIYKDMESIEANPMEYFSEYQKVYINKEFKKMEEDSISLIINKIKIFLSKLNENQ